MKNLELEKVIADSDSSFKAAVFENTYFTSPLHFHPEYEIVLIEKGYGFCFCGDYVGKFKPGDIAVFGKMLPHFYLSDNKFYRKGNTEKCKSVYIQFDENLLPLKYKLIPAFKTIYHLLSSAERGICFSGKENRIVSGLIRSTPYLSGFEKIMNLYNILNQLGNLSYSTILASSNFQNNDISCHPVYQKVTSYIKGNYQHEITLDKLAKAVCMNRSALCRRFKSITGKTIFEFINECRIAYACKLIANTDTQISAIAYDCGFNNVSYFDSLFKSMTNYSPTGYREIFAR